MINTYQIIQKDKSRLLAHLELSRNTSDQIKDKVQYKLTNQVWYKGARTVTWTLYHEVF